MLTPASHLWNCLTGQDANAVVFELWFVLISAVFYFLSCGNVKHNRLKSGDKKRNTGVLKSHSSQRMLCETNFLTFLYFQFLLLRFCLVCITGWPQVCYSFEWYKLASIKSVVMWGKQDVRASWGTMENCWRLAARPFVQYNVCPEISASDPVCKCELSSFSFKTKMLWCSVAVLWFSRNCFACAQITRPFAFVWNREAICSLWCPFMFRTGIANSFTRNHCYA